MVFISENLVISANCELLCYVLEVGTDFDGATSEEDRQNEDIILWLKTSAKEGQKSS